MPKVGANERLQRLLAIVPWVVAQDGPTVEEICSRFGIGEEELLADLDQLWLCGVYPYTPDVLVEVDIADGRVWIRYADFFRRPLRLTPGEGLALLSAGAALRAVPGADPSGPLARALAKLAALVGVEPDETVEVELAPVAADVLGVVQEGAAGHRRVELDYYSFGRDGRTRRQVDPWRVFNAAGQWYVDGWCHLAGGRRLFRVDRIVEATLLATTFEPRPDEPDHRPLLYSPRPGDPGVTLRIAPAARWVADRYPTESARELPDGGLELRLRVSEAAWLERLLLRLGPDATVLEGDKGLRPRAASRLLSRYRRPSGDVATQDRGSTLAP